MLYYFSKTPEGMEAQIESNREAIDAALADADTNDDENADGNAEEGSTYIDENGNIVVVDQDGNTEVFNPDGTPINTSQEADTSVTDAVTDAVGAAATDDEEATGLFKEIEDLVEQGSTLEAAIDTVATKIGDTEEELLAKLNTTKEALADSIASVTDAVGAAATDDEEATGLFKEIEDLVEQGSTLEAAIDTVATKIGDTEEELLAKLNTTKEALADSIASVTDAVGAAATDDEEATGLFKEIEDLVEQGSTLEAAIDTVATKIGDTEEELLAKLNTTKEALADSIASVTDAVGAAATDDEEATGLFKEIEDLVKQGDTLEEAIGKVATKIDTTEEEL